MGMGGPRPARVGDSRPLRVGRPRPPASLLALFGVAMLSRAAQNVAQTSIAPIGETDAHLPTAVIGLVIALTGVVTVAATLYCGHRAAQGSVRRWLAAGLALTAGSLPVLALSRSWPMLLGGSCLLGAGGGFVFPSLASLVGRHGSAPPHRRMAGFALALSVSLSVGPLLDSAVLSASHDSLAFTLAVFTSLPLLALVLLPSTRARTAAGRGVAGAAEQGGVGPTERAVVGDTSAAALAPLDLPPSAETPLPPPPRPADTGRTDPADDPTDPTDPTTGAGPAPAPSTPEVPPWGRPGWRLAVAAQLLYQVPFVAVISFGVVAGEHLDGVRLAEAQLGISAFFALSMLTRAAVTAARPVRRPRRAVLLVAVTTVAGVLLFAAGHSAAEMFAALAILGIPHGLVYPVALGLIAGETPPSQLVRANAAFAACTSTVSAVMPAVLGGIGAAAGLRVMFLTLLVPVAGVGLLVATWPGLRVAPAGAAGQ